MTGYDQDYDVTEEDAYNSAYGGEYGNEYGEQFGPDDGLAEVGADPGLDSSAYIQQAIDVVCGAKTMPLSSSVLISRDELLAVLQEAAQRIPEEMRQARWLLKEREEFLERTRRDGEEILNAARARAAHMVERTEIVRHARATARRTIDAADEEAARLRHEAEDFCDQKLAAFEIVLDRTTKMVKAGRDKLKVTPAPLDGGLGGLNEPAADGEIAGSDPASESGEVFFDQDES